MNKFFLITFLLIGLIIHAQTYTFDFELTIESSIEKQTKEVYTAKYLINTKDDSYRLYMKNDGTAILSDNNRKMYINLLIKKNAQTNQTVILFQGERKFNEEKEWFSSTKNLGNNQFLISSFDNKKMRKSVNDIQISVEEAPANLLLITSDLGYAFDSSLYKNINLSLNSTKTYLIRKSTVDYKNGYVIVFNLKSFEKKELSFSLPEKTK